MKTPLKIISFLAGAALLAASNLNAATTQPVGYTTLNINAGTGTSRALSVLGVPLYQPTQTVAGASSGVISGITENTITVANAGWTPGGLSTDSAPFCLRLTKDGSAAEGRNLLISTSVDNSTDTLTVDLAQSGVSSLLDLGITTGDDTFELVECDTLSSLFGAPALGGVVGGSTQETADIVFLFVNGSWSRFYYDTDLGNWKKVSFFDNDASNQVLLPDTGLLYSRLDDSASEFVLTGTVPATDREVTVNAAGVTVLGNAWPTDIRLDQTGIESINEWNSTTLKEDADKVFVFSGSSWSRYFHDGTDWRQVSFFENESNSVVISAGSAVLLVKNSPASSNQELVQLMPYTL